MELGIRVRDQRGRPARFWSDCQLSVSGEDSDRTARSAKYVSPLPWKGVARRAGGWRGTMSDWPYNSKLTPRARELRTNATNQENHLWYDYLRSYRPRFTRQRIVGNYILDFYCGKVKLAVRRVRILKYIQVRHMDYWWGVYNVGEFKQEYIDGLEFSLTNDSKGEELFFHFDLWNLPCLEQMIAEEEFMEKGDPDYDLLLHQYNALKNHETDFFIADLFYFDEKHENGYGYLSLGKCRLNGNSIFELRNKNNEKPYYGVIFINESEALIPEKVIKWMEKLSTELFQENFQLQFANIPNKNEILNS